MSYNPVIPGVLGNVQLGGSFPAFHITSYSLDGGYNLVNVSGYGGGGIEEFVQALQRAQVTLRGFLDSQDPKLIPPARNTVGALTLTIDSDAGKTYQDNVILGAFTLVGQYAGANEYTVSVAHAAGTAVPSVSGF